MGTGLAAIYITSWDFLVIQKMMFRLDPHAQIGFFLTVSGAILRQLARKALGQHFSYPLRIITNHEMKKNGVYRHIRHPAYTGFIMIVLGIPLIFGSLYGFLIALSLIPAIIFRIRIEEKMLVEEFGVAYLNYTEKTEKLIPYFY